MGMYEAVIFISDETVFDIILHCILISSCSQHEYCVQSTCTFFESGIGCIDIKATDEFE